MKSHSKRIRLLRRLAIAGCLAALAVPAGASARPLSESSGSEQAQYTLPSGFHTDARTQPTQNPGRPFVLPSGFKSDVQTSPPQASAPTPSIVRQIETVTDDGGRTLAIVLAAVALAVALCSLAYTTLRGPQIQRRGLGTH